MELTFNVCFPGEMAAGLRSYTETVTIAVESRAANQNFRSPARPSPVTAS